MKSPDDPNHRFLCLTGVIFNLGFVASDLQPELEALKTKYFGSHPDDPVIMHRKGLVHKKPPFHALAYPEKEKLFNTEFVALLNKWEYTVIGVVLDKQEYNINYASTWKYDPYHYCKEIILERFRLFLNMNQAVGDVMIESRGGKEDKRLKRSFRRLMDNGTGYLSPEKLAEHITSKELKVKVKSANIAGLQLADLMAHAVRRYGYKTIWDLKDDRTTFSDTLIEILTREKFFRYKGKIASYGLKKLP